MAKAMSLFVDLFGRGKNPSVCRVNRLRAVNPVEYKKLRVKR